MNKKNNMAVKREGLTQDLFDLFIVLAKRDGFDMSNAKWKLKEYSLQFLCINAERKDVYQGDIIDGNLNIITHEEMAFCGAPDWAVDVRKKGGEFVWTNGKQDFQHVCENTPLMIVKFDVKNWPVVITRTPKEKLYIPEVGEECLTSTGKVKVIHVTPIQIVLEDEDNHLFILDQGAFDSIKPIPKHSEEELLAYELFKDMYPKSDAGIDSFFNEEGELFNYQKYLKAIKSGWRKTK